MGTVRVTARSVEVRLTTREKLAGLLGDLSVPRHAVTGAQVVADGLAAAHGLRAPGLGLPGVAKIGTWRARGDKQYVVARRGLPAVRLTVTGQRYDTVIVSTADAQALATELAVRA